MDDSELDKISADHRYSDRMGEVLWMTMTHKLVHLYASGAIMSWEDFLNFVAIATAKRPGPPSPFSSGSPHD
jgi:hypothetical protein